MRRNAITGFLIAAGVCMATGCSSTAPHYRTIGTNSTDPIVDSSLTRVSGTIDDSRGNLAGRQDDSSLKKAYAKGNVPDTVMLRDQTDMGYRDEVVPNQ